MVITCPLGTHLTAGGLKVMDPRWGGRYDREGAEGHGPDRGSKFKREGTLYSKIMLTFQLFAVFKIRLIFEAILVPTWLHFGRILGVLGASGRLLGGRSASWGRLGAALERLGGILGRLGASWGRLGAILEASWAPKHPQDKPDSTWNGKRRSF